MVVIFMSQDKPNCSIRLIQEPQFAPYRSARFGTFIPLCALRLCQFMFGVFFLMLIQIHH